MFKNRQLCPSDIVNLHNMLIYSFCLGIKVCASNSLGGCYSICVGSGASYYTWFCSWWGKILRKKKTFIVLKLNNKENQNDSKWMWLMKNVNLQAQLRGKLFKIKKQIFGEFSYMSSTANLYYSLCYNFILS